MDSMNDIIWSVGTQNDEFENIFYRMREHATELLESKDYTVHFDFDEALNHNKLNMQSRRDFYLIYKEVLNNIAKYAGGNNVWISLNLKDKIITLNIKDDGKGFDINKEFKSGNGLINIKKRADALRAALQISSSPNNGTEIKLSLAQHS